MALWIAIYCILALIPYLRKKHSWIHYIWVLLPIQFYGITIGGVTLKPFMFFVAAIILFSAKKNKISGSFRISRSFIQIFIYYAFAQIIVDCFNDSNLQSYMNQCLFLLVIVLAIVYCSTVNSREPEYRKMFEAIFDAGFSYALICIAAIIIYSLKIDLPNIVAQTTKEPGFFVGYSTMLGKKWVYSCRFRGFTGDPNLLPVSFIVPCVTGYYLQHTGSNLIAKTEKIKFLALLLLSFIIIVFSDSRTGIIVFTSAFILSFSFIGKNKSIKTAFAILVGMALFYITIRIGLIDTLLNSGRSSLLSDTGRVAIWKRAWDVLNEENLFLGIGTARMVSSDYLGIYCHNTWLEWLCSDGIILGSIVTVFFLLFGFHQYRAKKMIDQEMAIALVICYYCSFLALITVDDLANVYLLFFMCLLFSFCPKNISKT